MPKYYLIFLLSLLLFLTPAGALLGVKANTGFYLGGGFGAFVSGKESHYDTAKQTNQKFGIINKELLLNEDLRYLNFMTGFSILGFSLEGEALYRYLGSTKKIQGTKTDHNNDGKTGFLERIYNKLSISTLEKSNTTSYLLGFVNTNLELSGIALFNPYIGIGIGTGSVGFTNENFYKEYGFPIATQIKAGLSLELESHSFISLKPYFGYRMLMASSLGAYKFSDAPDIIPNMDPNTGTISKMKKIITEIGEISHTSHNIEVGIKVHMGA